VVESADLRQGKDASLRGWLNGARLGSILLECEMRAGTVVVAQVAAQTTTKVSLIQDDHVVEELATNVPITRSTKGFCQGEQGAVRTSAMSIPFTPRRNSPP